MAKVRECECHNTLPSTCDICRAKVVRHFRAYRKDSGTFYVVCEDCVVVAALMDE